MNLYNRNVNFSQDEQSEKTIIKVFDTDSQELIKQFPSEDLIKLAQKINGLRQDIDLKSGIFLDEKV
jgi:flagellar protein FlaG